ncbi:MAG: SH3 domain-containing protein [Clostridia bacterium]|nr:SH3 domain-containing protein [Clostridia bacterium]
MKRWLAAMMALVLLLMLLPVSSMAAQYATVKGGWLRLRSNPSYSAQTLASYYTGTVVEVLGTSGAWYHVRLSDGNTGYMHGDYLTAGVVAPGGTSVSGNATVVSSNGYGVRLRVGPGTNYRVIRKFPVGTPATILQSGNYWCKISIGGYTGYMMSQFLSTYGGSTGGSSSGSVSYVGDATIWSGNGYGVRLRTGPGKEYSKIGVYSVGTQVKIITKGAVWDYIEVGSRRGYMMNEFLIYNDNYTVNGVTINNLSPVVGNVLAVQSVTPSTATVTYEWLVKPQGGTETVKGTTAAYLVTDADVNATIRLKVTGAGRYKGTAYSASTAAVVKTGTVDGLTLNITDPYVGDVLRPVLTPSNASVTYIWTVGGVQKSNESTYTVTAADVGKTIGLRVDGKYPFSGTKSITTNAVTDTAVPVITTATLPNGTYQTAYSKQLEANGGGSMVWSVVSGSLPAGLTLSQNGLISGTPTECATKAVTVQASNEKGKVTKELTLTVEPVKVNLPDVNGVAVPVKDATAVTAIADSAQYTGTVTWSPALNGGKFDAGTVYTATIALTAKPNYTFTGLTASFFKVAGSANTSSTVGGNGSTATVTAVFPATATAAAVKLDKPVITGITKQDSSWVISWNAVTNAAGYKVRRAGETPTEWVSTTATSYTLTEEPMSTTYQVCAVGDGVQYETSDPADFVYSVAPESVQLAAPTNGRVEQVDGVWKALWDAVPNASGYKFRQTNGSNTWYDLDTTSYSFINAPQDGDTYEVMAVGNGSTYTDSVVAGFTYTVTPPAPPAPAEPDTLPEPANLAIAYNGSNWIATWEAVEHAQGYRFRLEGSGWHDCGSNTYYTFVNPPQTGNYQVQALGDGTNYKDSGYATLPYTKPETPDLADPTNLKIEFDGSSNWVATWSAVEHAQGYRFRLEGSGWHDCGSNTYYTFVNPPQTGSYQVQALGDGVNYDDSGYTTVPYTQPAPETASDPDPASNPDPATIPDPASNPDPENNPDPASVPTGGADS